MNQSYVKKLGSLAFVAVIVLATYWLNQRGLGLVSTPVSASQSTLIATSTTTVASTTIPLAATSGTHIQTNTTVVHVTDGDTISVRIDGEKGDVNIRFLGMNTPETVDPRRPVECFGKEASNFTKAQLSGKRIFLKDDPQADNIDKYGRLLREIILEDGTNYNELLVKSGYAYAYTSFPESRDRKIMFNQLQAEAKAAQVGLWNPSTCNGQK